ncbi:hypothetical protein [uncultured Thiocystis sp.]|jgi:hypothetical protein|uniref:hypothetical protein n=1 Tax=uncultured Thiocystis sp. TaxID=1202134 RepID=UPI0025DFC03B|nr:hypothetical protein [uncultured Thiocystis sp.]
MIAVSLSAFSDDILQQPWKFEPGARLSLFYDDNVRLSVDDPEASLGGLAEIYGLLAWRTEKSSLGLRAAIDGSYYDDISELNTTDGSLDFTYDYRMSRVKFGLVTRLRYDSTLTSEDEADTTGVVQANKRRTSLEIGPSIGYDLTERARINAEYTFLDVSYEDAEAISLSNFQNSRLGFNTEYDLSERSRLLGRLSYEQYESDEVSQSSESFGVEAGFRFQFSERTTLSALGGARFASIKSDGTGQSGSDDENSSGPLLEVGLDRIYERGTLRLSLERSLLPSGRGSLLDTTIASVIVSSPLTERLTSSLTARGIRNRNPGDEVNANDRDYLILSPALRWRLNESSWLDLSYRYRWQDREVLDGIADSNSVYFGYGYDWGRR